MKPTIIIAWIVGVLFAVTGLMLFLAFRKVHQIHQAVVLNNTPQEVYLPLRTMQKATPAQLEPSLIIALYTCNKTNPAPGSAPWIDVYVCGKYSAQDSTIVDTVVVLDTRLTQPVDRIAEYWPEIKPAPTYKKCRALISPVLLSKIAHCPYAFGRVTLITDD